MPSKPLVLTVEYEQIVHILRTELLVIPATSDRRTVQTAPFQAIWDTGATHTTITQRVVKALGLTPFNVLPVMTANGPTHNYTYLIHLALQSKAIFTRLEAIEGQMSGGDVLICMDVISQGDFAITNAHGATTYSFRVPSLKHIDFGQAYEAE